MGETCYEVPVGFKHISAKMAETDALIGGESSGGLTVHGHINGKDGIYAATLLVEMIALSGKSFPAFTGKSRSSTAEPLWQSIPLLLRRSERQSFENYLRG